MSDNEDVEYLTTEQMSALTGCPQDYLDKCVATGYLSPKIHAAAREDCVGGQEREAAEAKEGGNNNWRPKTRHVTARDAFVQWWYRSPCGRARLIQGAMVREICNTLRGFAVNNVSPIIETEVGNIAEQIYKGVILKEAEDANEKAEQKKKVVSLKSSGS